MTPFKSVKTTVASFAICVALLPAAAWANQVAAEIQTLVEVSLNDNSVVTSQLDIAVVVPSFYATRDYAPAWGQQEDVSELLEELEKGVAQGFNPKDFGLNHLVDLYTTAQVGNDADKATFDLFATDAAIKLIHHLVFGKVDPASLDSDWNFDRPVIKEDPATVLNNFLNGEGFASLMQHINIKNAQYLQLIDALEYYKSIEAKGGWPMVPDAVVLKPGITDPAITALRARLAMEAGAEVMPASAKAQDETNPVWTYDTALEQAVIAFQSRHGLEADGVIGGKTFASLNKPVSDRINKIRLSLERGRWLMRGTDDEFILVNIAGARTYLSRADEGIWTTRSITGSEYRKTPVFRDEIKYMEFNPTWTVPSSIFRKDKLSRIRNDPGYLDRNNYIVRNKDGATISASAVNWNAENPGVTLVQQPGPSNALGLVKFMFPNKYAVYLHDTNDRSLFDRNERNLSSGCVRVENPFQLAMMLMADDPSWTEARMQSILDSGKTTRVDLTNPMPVMLTYWTSWVENGTVHFREDPYDRDAAVLKALDK
ncbi:MAG: L,D-transpeptidase family protein [Pseudoruegeria sp.]